MVRTCRQYGRAPRRRAVRVPVPGAAAHAAAVAYCGAGTCPQSPSTTVTRMSPSKKKKAAATQASRVGKTMQYEPVSQAISEALETEAWYRRHLMDPSQQGGRKGRGGDGAHTREALFEEALRWFLKAYEHQPPDSFDLIQRSWPRTAFWIDDSIFVRCKAMAERWGVDKRQLMATAFRLYAKRLVTPKLAKFRARTYEQARELYLEHRSTISPGPRAKKGS